MEEKLKETPVGKQFLAHRYFDDKKFRCKREEGGTVFVFAPKRRRYGWRYSEEAFLREYTDFEYEEKDENAEWHHRIDRAVKALEASGLWDNILETLRELSLMTWEDKKALESLYFKYHFHLRYDPANNAADKWRPLVDAYNAEVAPFLEKYPFAFTGTEHFTLDDGSDAAIPNICSTYITELSDVRLKAMYFGKHVNNRVKAVIADAIGAGTEFTHRCRTSYDVSFSYNPAMKKAWYSEEYKDCGNGHYYLALNNNLALFCEND